MQVRPPAHPLVYYYNYYYYYYYYYYYCNVTQIRYGFDPTKDPLARFLQALDVRWKLHQFNKIIR